jgi:hypothetical protein
MNFTRFCFHSTLSMATTVITTCTVVAPSQAFELIFSSPNVLSGIKGVSFTLPSTGITKIYNVTLKEGTIFDVYGNPPKFDLVTEIDARVAMEESARGIDYYLANVSPDLLFLGKDIFYIPYKIDPVTQVGSYWSSGKKYNDDGTVFVNIRQVDFPADIPVVHAHFQPVPEPLTILGTATALGFGAFFKRKLKSSESSEKETINVG